ncbi:uncharacterized protein LOC110683778 [Chenopodium quinoa]|uniref:uncharacterized protein LOC110683778 n=1 Tax=Chenopodium quinoa TaxID=63459 RepID=UPI000B771C4F|nr:uncharacterized protein LOC110683778 [Chenopodium quinoa]
MCPEMISETYLHSDVDRILLYMTHVMEKQKSKQFILCPYHEKNHWVLLVLCMAKREVIIFDSLRQKRNLVIKFAMTNVLNNWVDVSVATTSCVICTKYLNITIAVRILFRYELSNISFLFDKYNLMLATILN